MVVGLLALATPIHAKEKEESVKQEQTSQFLLSARTDFLSKYLLRGTTISETPVIQPTLSATYRTFSLVGLGNFDTQTGNFSEADLTLDFTKPLSENVTLSIGYTLLTFPNTQSEKTQEVYAVVTLDKPLKPTIRAYHDFDEGKGIYGELFCGHDFNLGKIGISIAGILGYNGHYFREDSGLSHLELRLSAPIRLGSSIILTPMVNYSKSLDKPSFQDELYGGISLNFSF